MSNVLNVRRFDQQLIWTGMVGNGKCSEVSSIMYSSASVLFGCGVHQPTTTCDGSVLNSTVYPTAPPTCTPVDSEWCYDAPPYSCS
jgi:hypothetical protein